MLLKLVVNQKLKSVSLVGMAKNVGKTVAFNHLVREAAGRGLALGLTSIGRDGEKTDAVFRIPKPGIYAPAGALLATARGTLRNCEAEVEVLAGTGFSTSLGEVVLCRVTAPGYVELAGATLVNHHRKVIRSLLSHGADLVLVDGALDRVSSAAPSLAEGTILSTGAALGPGIPDVLAKTRDRVERFGLPPVAGSKLRLCRDLMDVSKAALVTRSGGVRVLETGGSLVAGAAVVRALTADTELVVLAGAVGNGVLEALTEGMANTGPVHLVIRNGTSLFAGRPVWQGFTAGGGTVSVVEPISLLAITVNPVSPTGPGFPPEAFLKAAGEALVPYPVVDVVMGKGSWPKNDGQVRHQ